MDVDDVNLLLESNDGAAVYVSPEQGLTSDSSAYQGLISTKKVIALTAAAVVALASASAAKIALFSGAANQGESTSCQSFDFKSYSDPVTTSTFSGQQIAQGENQTSLKNWNTVYNTLTGPTVISTTVGLSPASGYYDNRVVSLTTNTWSLSAATLDHANSDGTFEAGSATISAVVIDHGISHTIALGQSYQTSDGSVVAYNAQGIQVKQPLASGGQLSTAITETENAQNVSFLNIDQSANSAAIISGDAVSLASGNANAVLASACSNSPTPNASESASIPGDRAGSHKSSAASSSSSENSAYSM